MSETYRIGPVHAFAGDFLDDGAGDFTDVIYLGKTRGDAIVRPNVQIARGRVDQLGGVPLASAIWLGAYAPEIVLPLVDEDKDKMKKYFMGSTKVTSGSMEALTFASSPQQITNASIPSLLLVPVRGSYTNFGSGEDPWNDPANYFFTGVIPRDLGDLVYGEITDTDDALNPHTTTLLACRRTLFADDATAVPSGKEVWFMGSPIAAGLNSAAGFEWPSVGVAGFNTLVAS